MKKTYQQPAITVEATTECMPIAASLSINNTAKNNISGDARADWNDIWADDDIAEE